ncbi:MAG: cadmium-translocating P-type ATPase [Methylobacteriaceae bacterium]|jgi:Cd2+/Zn2+-exporting ATPase|nr:cadmium-translocating P-type ATPase [Methylobacteriaceae bacterium]
MASIVLHIEGMDCAECASRLERALTRVNGIHAATVSLMAETATVDYADGAALQQARERIRKLGFEVGGSAAEHPASCGCGHDHAHDHEHDHGHGHGAHDHHHHDHAGMEEVFVSASPLAALLKQKSVRTILLFAAVLLAAWLIGLLIPQLNRVLFWCALAFGLYPIVRTVLASFEAKEYFTIETLLVIAAVGAVLIGEEEEAAVVVLLFLIGEFLEGYAASRARAGIRSLKQLAPSRAILLAENGETREVDAETLKLDDTILIRPGDGVPADGLILEGTSTLNEAALTGESAPRLRSPGEDVFAGTVNLDGTLTVRVTGPAGNNMISRVVRLVEQAQDAKAPTQRFIDHFARYYTPCVLLLGIVVAVLPPLLTGAPWLEWIYKGLAILLIGCPCALVISTPAAVVSALANGARSGMLIKGGEILEKAGRITHAAFDKTGTLTAGKPVVTDVVTFGVSREELLALAAGLEATSSHPLADAVREAASAGHVTIAPVGNIAVVVGKGVSGRWNGTALFFGSATTAGTFAPVSDDARAQIEALRREGKSVSVLTSGSDVLGLVALRDEPRADAAAGLRELTAMNIRPLMVTGDSEATAQAIGAALGLTDIRAGLLPEDKLNVIRELQAKGAVVAKVGDGINDAPGLAAADIGIAMGQATDVALETADSALLGGRVADVARLIRLSRRTLRVIHENIAMALGLKAVFLVTTLAGITGLWPAVLADTGATVLVTINSLRLLRGGK